MSKFTDQENKKKSQNESPEKKNEGVDCGNSTQSMSDRFVKEELEADEQMEDISYEVNADLTDEVFKNEVEQLTVEEFISDFELISNEILEFDNQHQVQEILLEVLERSIGQTFEFVKLIAIKFLILRVSAFFGLKSDLRSRTIAAVGYFYALTKYHFTNCNYRGFDTEVSIRECDLTNPDKIYQKNPKSFEEQLEDLSTVIVSKTKLVY